MEQLRHAVAPTPLKRPGSQTAHLLAFPSEKVSDAHHTHETNSPSALAALYCPSPHGEQAVLPWGETKPGGHGEQRADPESEAVPLGQSEQLEAEEANHPASHASQPPAPAPDTEPAGHGVH